MKTTLSNLINWGSQELKNARISNSTREAYLILDHILGKNTISLDPQFAISPANQKKFQKLITRRMNHEPFAYLTGKVVFCGHEIDVNKNTLIPRPETEILVELVSNHLAAILSSPNKAKDLTAADIGTGSGAIAISLTKKFFTSSNVEKPELNFIATDKYQRTLKIAKKNIYKYHLENQIALIKSDLLNTFEKHSLDIIIANLPYIPEREFKNIDKTVKDFEPYQALFSGPDGLNLIKKLLRQAASKLKPGGSIFLEIWPTQARDIKNLVAKLFPCHEVTFHPDLVGITRFVQIQTTSQIKG